MKRSASMLMDIAAPLAAAAAAFAIAMLLVWVFAGCTFNVHVLEGVKTPTTLPAMPTAAKIEPCPQTSDDVGAEPDSVKIEDSPDPKPRANKRLAVGYVSAI